MYLCLNCDKELTPTQISYKAKFCSRSCSAKYSNSRRPARTNFTKQKTSNSLKIYNKQNLGQYSKISFCIICNSIIRNRHGKVCSKICQNKLNSQTRKDNKFAPTKQLTNSQELERRYRIHCSASKWGHMTYDDFIKSSKSMRQSLTIQKTYDGINTEEKYENIKRKNRKEKDKSGMCIVCGENTKNYRKTCSEKCLYKSREWNCGHSKKFKVFDSDNEPCTLGSTWEYQIYNFILENNIRWIRPAPIKYFSKSKNKFMNYFGDFYLPDYNLWIDPKNSYVQQIQSEKLEVLIKEIDLIIGEPQKIINELKERLNIVLASGNAPESRQ